MKQIRKHGAADALGTRIYLSVLFWFLGKAVQACAAVDPSVREEFSRLPEGFTFILSVWPNGPGMTIAKQLDGRVRYLGSGSPDGEAHLRMVIASPALAMSLFTFRESTALAAARERLFVHGSLSDACAMVRVLDLAEIYLLPRFIAVRAVKRYQSPSHRRRRRAAIYMRVLTGWAR